ncbi:hypothetical protein RF11_11923 [Thelohanellus kitauei]|uniref:Uncharacterized protein n=1 Tax=Thelohanellus kitauei TaxID=669202 RepID=A0A0C2J6M9_THEKT|nr:hypothetical protein RF11_11923 [Thelohanellus kitauei]
MDNPFLRKVLQCQANKINKNKIKEIDGSKIKKHLIFKKKAKSPFVLALSIVISFVFTISVMISDAQSYVPRTEPHPLILRPRFRNINHFSDFRHRHNDINDLIYDY